MSIVLLIAGSFQNHASSAASLSREANWMLTWMRTQAFGLLLAHTRAAHGKTWLISCRATMEDCIHALHPCEFCLEELRARFMPSPVCPVILRDQTCMVCCEPFADLEKAGCAASNTLAERQAHLQPPVLLRAVCTEMVQAGRTL